MGDGRLHDVLETVPGALQGGDNPVQPTVDWVCGTPCLRAVLDRVPLI